MKRLLSIAAVIGWAIVFALAPNDARAERRVALVVGNSSYATVPRLPNPTRDASAIADLFKKAGFDTVETYLDVGNLDFKRAIRKFEDTAMDADVAVLYYAGHGIEIGGTNYLIPVDARLASDRDAADEAIPLQRLVLSADGAKKLRLIILDACRDNPFAGKMRRESRAALRAVSAGLSKEEPSSTDTLIAYAAKAGSTAEDGDQDHSPFTAALLKYLTEPGLDLRFVFGKVKDEVVKLTDNRQEPYVYGSLGGGNFSLVPAPAQPKGQMTAALAAEIKARYELVEKVGTPRAYEVFLASYPEGFYSDLAREQLKKLPETTTIEPTPPINHGPSTRELIDWEKVKDSSNIDALRSFIRRYPGSNLSVRAQNRLEILEAAEKEREAKAKAEAERQRAEAAAAKRREEEERRAAAAEAAQRAKALEAERKAEAARLKAEEAARNKAAAEAERLRIESEKSARLAEEERRKAELAAAQEAACKIEGDRFDAIAAKENTPANVEDLRRFAKEASCERVRPQITAKLDAWTTNTPELIKVAQTELTRINCYTGAADGALTETTRISLSRYLTVKKRPAKDPRVTEDLVGELRKQAAFTCPTICARGETAHGATCVVNKPAPAQTVKRREPEKPRKQAERRQEQRQQPQRQPQRQQASSGGGRASSMIGIGF